MHCCTYPLQMGTVIILTSRISWCRLWFQHMSGWNLHMFEKERQDILSLSVSSLSHCCRLGTVWDADTGACGCYGDNNPPLPWQPGDCVVLSQRYFISHWGSTGYWQVAPPSQQLTYSDWSIQAISVLKNEYSSLPLLFPLHPHPETLQATRTGPSPLCVAGGRELTVNTTSSYLTIVSCGCSVHARFELHTFLSLHAMRSTCSHNDPSLCWCRGTVISTMCQCWGIKAVEVDSVRIFSDLQWCQGQTDVSQYRQSLSAKIIAILILSQLSPHHRVWFAKCANLGPNSVKVCVAFAWC